MKRIVLVLTILALVLSFASVSVAEITEKGVKVGLNMANLTGDDVEDTDNKMGFAAGAYAILPLNESIDIQIEALYSQKGCKESGEVSYYGYSFDYDATVKLTYIEIPVLFKYGFSSSGSMKPCIFAGPYLALKMGAKVTWESEGESETDDIEDVKGMDYGIIVGVGAKITDKISVDARYGMGMSTIYDIDDVSVKNKVIAVTAGYAL